MVIIVKKMNSLRIASYNCNGVRSKLPMIGDLCDKSDLVLLQETWLFPTDLTLLDSVHGDFCSASQSSIDMENFIVGRPFGGLSILWRKCLEPFVSVLDFQDARLSGVSICTSEYNVLFIKVYLPFRRRDNTNTYNMYMGKGFINYCKEQFHRNICRG